MRALPKQVQATARAQLGLALEPRATRAPAAKKAPRAPKAKAADLFPRLCHAAGVPTPTPEHQFHPTRRWRFDYAWPANRVALEVEGGVWTGGRHTRGSGFLGDVEKYNAAAVAGWRVLRCTPKTLTTSDTLRLIRDALDAD